ncbi:hypothetical protein D3C79_834460 [compost metagenome]
MLADRRHQGLGGDLLGAFHCQAVTEGRAFDRGLLVAVALGQHQAVVEGLVAAGAAGRPGDLAVAVDAVDADPVVVGDEALVEADVVAVQRWHEHLHLDRVLGAGHELDLGVDVPQVVGFILGHRDAEEEDLVSRDRHTQ